MAFDGALLGRKTVNWLSVWLLMEKHQKRVEQELLKPPKVIRIELQ